VVGIEDETGLVDIFESPCCIRHLVAQGIAPLDRNDMRDKGAVIAR
jgi:hypothetical protein